MSNPSDKPWTEEDKYTLLTEILKKAGISSSHLVHLIKDYGITPNWEHIPLPQGRSISSCKTAYLNMIQQHTVQPPTQRSSYATTDTGKRALHPDKPAPRAIQPRPPGPPASTTSYGSESGSSAQLSPRLDPGEPPRKRGRPSKAETERRKLLAEARGEPYPSRRQGHQRVSSASPAQLSFPFPKPHLQLQAPPEHPPPNPPAPQSIYDVRNEGHAIPPNMRRELPRPTPLPSPHALQLGPPDAFPRPNPERYGWPDDRRNSGSRPE